MSFIICEVNLTLAWSENFLLADITILVAVSAQKGDPERQAINAATYATFKITDTKLFVPVFCFINWLW